MLHCTGRFSGRFPGIPLFPAVPWAGFLSRFSPRFFSRLSHDPAGISILPVSPSTHSPSRLYHSYHLSPLPFFVVVVAAAAALKRACLRLAL